MKIEQTKFITSQSGRVIYFCLITVVPHNDLGTPLIINIPLFTEISPRCWNWRKVEKKDADLPKNLKLVVNSVFQKTADSCFLQQVTIF